MANGPCGVERPRGKEDGEAWLVLANEPPRRVGNRCQMQLLENLSCQQPTCLLSHCVLPGPTKLGGDKPVFCFGGKGQEVSGLESVVFRAYSKLCAQWLLLAMLRGLIIYRWCQDQTMVHCLKCLSPIHTIFLTQNLYSFKTLTLIAAAIGKIKVWCLTQLPHPHNYNCSDVCRSQDLRSLGWG